jgi:hypothetical protein
VESSRLATEFKEKGGEAIRLYLPKHDVSKDHKIEDLKRPFYILKEKDFQVTSNLFGTLFHPIPIFNWLKYACANRISEDEMQLVFHEEMWKSLGGGKALRLHSKEALEELIRSKLRSCRYVCLKLARRLRHRYP